MLLIIIINNNLIIRICTGSFYVQNCVLLLISLLVGNICCILPTVCIFQWTEPLKSLVLYYEKLCERNKNNIRNSVKYYIFNVFSAIEIIISNFLLIHCRTLMLQSVLSLLKFIDVVGWLRMTLRFNCEFGYCCSLLSPFWYFFVFFQIKKYYEWKIICLLSNNILTAYSN